MTQQKENGGIKIPAPTEANYVGVSDFELDSTEPQR